MNRFIRPVAAILMSVLLALVPSLASAGVTSASPGATYGPYQMCSSQDNNFCWVSNGVGNQLTINTGNWADLTWISDGKYDGDFVYEFQNAAGHCVYVNGSGAVNLISAACNGSNNERFASVLGSSAIMWFNIGFSGYAYVAAVQDNRDVWAGQLTGHYYNWEYCTNATCNTGHGVHRQVVHRHHSRR